MNELRSYFSVLLLAALAMGQPVKVTCQNAPDVNRIVTQLVVNNQKRAAVLRHYQGCRRNMHDYTGFPSDQTAELVVEMKHYTPAGKQFRVVRETGSQLLLNKIFKELLVSEKEASDEQHRNSSGLTPENYDFQFVGSDVISARPQFVLQVKPRSQSKFLYKGKVWVDATDYAVSRMVAEPAKNPSFWVSHTEIEQEYKKIGEFWFPERNVSVKKVRLGGAAKLSIQYLSYRVGTAEETGLDVSSKLPQEVQISSKQER